MQGIPNLWGERYEFSDLTLWRKIVSLTAAGGALVFVLLVGLILPSKELDIYHSAPTAPVEATQQTYPVQVEHGYLRYVTQKEADDLIFWRNLTGPTIGGLLVVAALVLLTYRHRVKRVV